MTSDFIAPRYTCVQVQRGPSRHSPLTSSLHHRQARFSCSGYTGHPHGSVEHSTLTFSPHNLKGNEDAALGWEWDDRNSLLSSKCSTCSCKSFPCSSFNPDHFYFSLQDQPIPPISVPIRPTPPISSLLLLRPVSVTTPSHRETVL